MFDMNEDLRQILAIVTEMQERMPTREELKRELSLLASKDELLRVERELSAHILANTEAVEALAKTVRGQGGFAKEIDHVLSRVSSIERRLGLATGIAG